MLYCATKISIYYAFYLQDCKVCYDNIMENVYRRWKFDDLNLYSAKTNEVLNKKALNPVEKEVNLLKRKIISFLLLLSALLMLVSCAASGEALLYAVPLGINQEKFETLIKAEPSSVADILSSKKVYYKNVVYNGYSCDMICTFQDDALLDARYIFPKSVQWAQSFYHDVVQKLEDRKFTKTTVYDDIENIQKQQYTIEQLTVTTFEEDTAFCLEVHQISSTQTLDDISYDEMHAAQLVVIKNLFNADEESYQSISITMQEKTVLCRFLLRMECGDYQRAAQFLDQDLNCSLDTIPFTSEGTYLLSSNRLYDGYFWIILVNTNTGARWNIRLNTDDNDEGCMIYSYYLTK